MLTVLEVTFPVFALVFCGYAGAHRRLLPEKAVEGINAFVFWFALPAMLFRVVGLRPIEQVFDPRFVGGYVLSGLIMFGLATLLGRKGLIDPAHRGPAESTANALTATHGNVGYLGLALFAEINRDWLPLVALIIIFDILVIITLSIALFELQTRQDSHRGWAVARTVLTGLARSPLVLSLAAGLSFSALGAQLPPVLENFTRLLANAAGPCALFAIGAALGGQQVAIDRPVVVMSLLKLAVHPLIVALMLIGVFQVPTPIAAVAILCATLPSASNTFILAQRYGLPTASISATVLVSTFAALLTVSAAIWLLGLK